MISPTDIFPTEPVFCRTTTTLAPRRRRGPRAVPRRGLGGLVATTVFVIAVSGCSPSGAKDEAAIAALMRSTWDRPESRLDASPVIVVGDSAVADWTQGAMGGRALLERSQGRWRVVLCAGDGIRTARGLTQVGLHPAVASALAAKLAQAERDVPAARLSAMAAFRGIVPMGEPS